MSVLNDVQEIASTAEQITRKIYRETFLLVQKIKPEEVSKINQELEKILSLIDKISGRSFKE